MLVCIVILLPHGAFSFLLCWSHVTGKHFLLDFLAACPYDLLVKTAGGSVRYQAWVRIPKLLRLHRVVVWYQKKVHQTQLVAPFIACCSELLTR